MKKVNSKLQVGVVLKTTDYSIFKYIKGNRKVDAINVKRLTEAFKKNYLPTTIIVNEFMEIIDGQHRLEVCKLLGLEVRYEIFPSLRLKDVHMYNSNQKVWSKMDYAISYAEAGIKSYQILLEFCKEYPDLNLGSCESLLTNSFDGANEVAPRLGVDSGRTKAYQNGDLEINMEDKVLGYNMASQIMRYKPYFKKFNSGVFVKAMISLFRNPKFDNDRMVSQVAKNPSALQQTSTVRQYKIMLQDIYNYNKTTANRVALYI